MTRSPSFIPRNETTNLVAQRKAACIQILRLVLIVVLVVVAAAPVAVVVVINTTNVAIEFFCNQEISGSKLGPETNYPQMFNNFPQSLYANAAKVGLPQLTFTSFPGRSTIRRYAD